eukprot:1160938-Rhodomonas_salina.1
MVGLWREGDRRCGRQGVPDTADAIACVACARLRFAAIANVEPILDLCAARNSTSFSRAVLRLLWCSHRGSRGMLTEKTHCRRPTTTRRSCPSPSKTSWSRTTKTST